jgi:small neutral amino acid transporter SnatA (MarC family)
MEHALTICREHLVPAIYRGVRDVFGLAVGDPIPRATPDDVNPILSSTDRAPISIRIAPSATPHVTSPLMTCSLHRSRSNGQSSLSYIAGLVATCPK